MTNKLELKKTSLSLVWSLIIILGVLLIDQGSKIYIKLHYPLTLYGDQAIVDWGFFKLLFVENKGMAMGTKLNDLLPFLSEKTAKLLLTIVRLIAIFAIGFWLWQHIKKRSSRTLIWALCLIFAGALGNIIDSVFYGSLFSSSFGQIATLLPEQGYAPLFFGHVVDMLQFPLASWVWPEWIPFIGGKSYTFFQYIFNIADTSISTGVGLLIVFNKKIFGQASSQKE